jgi:hypothetical protein
MSPRPLEHLRALPGVLGAGIVGSLPPYSEPTGALTIAEHGAQVDQRLPGAASPVASPGYLGALQIRVLRNRAFSAHDKTEAAEVAVINQTLAGIFFLQQDPIGALVG